jgi:hypothetical protein
LRGRGVEDETVATATTGQRGAGGVSRNSLKRKGPWRHPRIITALQSSGKQ